MSRRAHMGRVREGEGAFTLVELLVVVAILCVLMALSLPALNSALAGSNLTRGSQFMEDAFLLARQEAVSKNREVEVRFYSFPVNGAAGWRAAQVFRVEQASGAASLVPVDRVVPLPNDIVISSSAALSPLLSADASIQGTVVLPGYGSATYAGFRYRPDGSTGSVVTSANNFLTFQEANDPASPPKNYCTLQINPVTGKVSSYRP